jgi:hypothetical protein
LLHENVLQHITQIKTSITETNPADAASSCTSQLQPMAALP